MFVILTMTIVIALLVATAARPYSTEQCINTNDTGRKLATTLVEATLCEGEDQVFDIEGKKTNFIKECKDSFCATPNVKSDSGAIEETATEGAWKRKCDENQNLYTDINGKEYSLGKNSSTVKNPRYIIEYLGKTTEGRIAYRVTTKAWSKNASTQVVLQSYIASE